MTKTFKAGAPLAAFNGSSFYWTARAEFLTDLPWLLREHLKGANGAPRATLRLPHKVGAKKR